MRKGKKTLCMNGGRKERGSVGEKEARKEGRQGEKENNKKRHDMNE